MAHLVLVAAAVLAGLAPAPTWAQGVTESSDGELLLAFKATFSNGDQVLSSWNGTDPCQTIDANGESSWLGVSCKEGRVLMIQLGDQGLKGTIPTEGYVLPPSMTIFNLYGNAISGSIPEAWRLPPSLLVVSLFSNQLSGSIPPGWAAGLPASLKVLYLNENRLSGSIPRVWNAPNISQLFLYKNQLTGGIPWSTWNLTTIYDLQLSDNQLTGVLPPDLQLPDITGILRLENNQLSGTLPSPWRLPPGLQEFRAAGNQLSGPLPADATFPTALQELDLSRNKLQGQLPGEWAASLPPTLQQLNLASNLLSGTLPSWPANSNTTVAIAPGNQFCGQVPTSPKYSNTTQAPVTSLPLCVDSGHSNTAAIAGGVVGGVVGLALAGVGAWWLLMRGRQQKVPAAADLEMQSPEEIKGEGLELSSAPNSLKSNKPILLLDDPLLAEINSRLDTLSIGVSSLTPSSGADSLAPRTGTSSSGDRGCGTSKGSSSCRELGVDVNQYLIQLRELAFVKQVGRGSFGRVYLCNWRETFVCAKLLLGPASSMASVSEAAELVLSQSSVVMNNLQQEAKLMAALRHPNVLGFIGLTLVPPCLVSEYCPRGSLYSILRDARENPQLAAKLTWTKRLRMALGAALGMFYLHSLKPPVIHRDLKSPNLLVASDWSIKVSDFNMSKIMGETSMDTSTNAVTNPTWLAPEVLRGESHTCASDIFSFGLVLWELLTWEMPWVEMANPWQVVTVVTAGGRPKIPEREQLPGPGKDFDGLVDYVALIQRCWAQKPEERPSFPDIISELRALLGRTGDLVPTASELADLPAAAADAGGQAEAAPVSGPSPTAGPGLDGADL